MTPNGEAADPPLVVATRIREARHRRGWSAQQLADECALAGMPSLDRSAITSIERGRRQRVGVDELLVLAFALDLSPVHLMLPLNDDALMQVVPSTTVTAKRARRWVSGQEQLPGRDAKQWVVFEAEAGWPGDPSGVAAVAMLEEAIAVATASIATIKATAHGHTAGSPTVTQVTAEVTPAAPEDGADDGER